jgi:hypothetical protein
MDLHPPTEVLVWNLTSLDTSSKMILAPSTIVNGNSSTEGDLSDADTNTSPLSSLCNSPCRMQVSIDDDDSDYDINVGCKEVAINAVSFDALRYSWIKRIDDVAVSRESRKSRIRASRTSWFTDVTIDNPDLKLPISITPEKECTPRRGNDSNEGSDEDRMDEKTSIDVELAQNSVRYLDPKLSSWSYDDSCQSQNTISLCDDLDNNQGKSTSIKRVRKRRIRYNYDKLDPNKSSTTQDKAKTTNLDSISKQPISNISKNSLLLSQFATTSSHSALREISAQYNTNPILDEEKSSVRENVELVLTARAVSPRSPNEDQLDDSFLSLNLLRQQLDPSLDEELRSISGFIDDGVTRETSLDDESKICSRANYDPQILVNHCAIVQSSCDAKEMMITMKNDVDSVYCDTPEISIDWGESFVFKDSEEKIDFESTTEEPTVNPAIISWTLKEQNNQIDTTGNKLSAPVECVDELRIPVKENDHVSSKLKSIDCPNFDNKSPNIAETSHLVPKDFLESIDVNGGSLEMRSIALDRARPLERNLSGNELLECSSFPEDEARVENRVLNTKNELLYSSEIQVSSPFRDSAMDTILELSRDVSDSCPFLDRNTEHHSAISSNETSSLDGLGNYPCKLRVEHLKWGANRSCGQIFDENVRTNEGYLSLSFPPYEIYAVNCKDSISFSKVTSAHCLSLPNTYTETTDDDGMNEPPALKRLSGNVRKCASDLVESSFPMDEIASTRFSVEKATEIHYAQINVSGELLAETIEVVQPSSPMAAFVASRCDVQNHDKGVDSTHDDQSTVFDTKETRTKSSAENMLHELEDMVKDLEETLSDEAGTNGVEDSTCSPKTSEEIKTILREGVPLLVISIDNDIGIPKGDIMLSLLSSNENESYDELMQDNVWPGKVKDAIWRCRTMRRNCDTKWLSSSVERNSPRHGQTRSIAVDVDDVRIVGGVESIGETQASVLEYLNCDDFSDALVMYESILDIYNNYAVENACSEHSIFQHKVYVATTLHNIGIIHLLNSNFQEAFTFFERATMIRASSLGVRHPDHIVSIIAHKSICM